MQWEYRVEEQRRFAIPVEDIVNDLRRSSATLESMVIVGVPEPLIVVPLDISTFVALNHLDVEVRALAGTDPSNPPDITTLPPGLTTLRIQSYSMHSGRRLWSENGII